MRTRCPACQTAFRVTDEQLGVRDGKVRCGHCNHVFNAIDTLDADASVSPPVSRRNSLFILEERNDAATGTPPDASQADAFGRTPDSTRTGNEPHAAPEAARGSKQGAPPGGGVIPTALFMKKASAPERKATAAHKILPTPVEPPVLTVRPAKASAPAEASKSAAPSAPTNGAGKPRIKTRARRNMRPGREPEADRKTQTIPEAGSVPDVSSGVTSSVSTTSKAESAPFAGAASAAARVPGFTPESGVAHSEAEAWDVESPDPGSTLVDADSEPSGESALGAAHALAALDELPGEGPRNTLRMSLMAGALIAILAAQTALVYRKALAQDIPALRPFFTTLCANIGCSMSLPRDAGKIRIEVSDLNRLPEKDDVFVLSATLRNESTTAQAYPYLELTLTNAQDRAVARRVFAPQEWLPAAPSERGLGAREEIEIVVPFSANELGASGYRLYVFHP